MKAVAVFPGTRTVGLTDEPEPQITQDDEVKVRILEVGVCGTDREITSFEYGSPPPGADHLVLGHESLGEVLEAGREVHKLKPGDLVVVTVRRPCEHKDCRPCQSRRPDFCYTGNFTERGIKGIHGFMTEVIVDCQEYVHKLPANLRDVGVLTEPLTIAEKALTQLYDIQDRMPWGCAVGTRNCQLNALVLGAGPVGILGAMAIAVRGYRTYLYSRPTQQKIVEPLLKEFGTEFISTEDVAVDGLTQRIGNIDLVYEATGAAAFSFAVLEELGTNGVFVFTGVPGRKAPIELNADRLMRNIVLKNQLVYGTVNAGPRAFEKAISDLQLFVERWPKAIRGLITGRFPMEEYARALDKSAGIKNVIEIG